MLFCAINTVVIDVFEEVMDGHVHGNPRLRFPCTIKLTANVNQFLDVLTLNLPVVSLVNQVMPVLFF